MELSEQETEETRRAALKFKSETRWIFPRILTGHKVAHSQPHISRITNFSTITQLVTLSSGRQIFLVYRYPTSWIHTLCDILWRWLTGLNGYKPLRRKTWQRIFERKSLIPIIPIGVPGVVAMHYLENINLYDALQHRWGRLSTISASQLYDCLAIAAEILNRLHAGHVTWGEPIAQNLLLKLPEQQPVLCDTEVVYYPWMTKQQRKVLDWHSFILSVVGACRRLDIQRADLAAFLARQIKDEQTATALRAYCRRPLTLRQKLIFALFGEILNCSCPTYLELREVINQSPLHNLV